MISELLNHRYRLLRRQIQFRTERDHLVYLIKKDWYDQTLALFEQDPEAVLRVWISAHPDHESAAHLEALETELHALDAELDTIHEDMVTLFTDPLYRLLRERWPAISARTTLVYPSPEARLPEYTVIAPLTFSVTEPLPIAMESLTVGDEDERERVTFHWFRAGETYFRVGYSTLLDTLFVERQNRHS